MSKRVPFEKFYEFHKLLIRCGKVGWTMEDSFYTLLNELDKANLLRCDRYDEQLDNVLKRSYIKMAYAQYAPRKLSYWADKAMNENPELIGALEDDHN